MNITLLPPKLEAKFSGWVFQKAYNFVARASKVYGRGGNNGLTAGVNQERETENAYKAVMRSSWMYYCIYTIGTSASQLPLAAFKRGPNTKGGDYTVNESSPYTKVLQNPNPVQTRDEFIDAIFWSLELSGKLFIECFPNKQTPQEMYVLDPRHMTPKKDGKKFVSGYEYSLDGAPVSYTPDEIIFHRYHNPADAHEGLAASTPAGDSVNSDILANEYNNEYFGNSAVPEGTLETEKRMTEPDVDALRMQWEKGHKGKRKRHRVAILYGGISFKPIQKSPRDMEFSKQKALNKEEIFAAYGVPLDMNDKEQRKMFWQQTMRPKLRGVAEKLTKEFGLDGFKEKIAFDLTDVEALQDDQEIKSRIAFNLQKSQTMTADEVRRIFYKLPPLSDGVGSMIWVPSNMVPAKLQINGPVTGPKQPTNPGKPGAPSGPDAQPKPNGQKPGANDGKPAGKNGDGHIEDPEYLEEFKLNEQILVG